MNYNKLILNIKLLYDLKKNKDGRKERVFEHTIKIQQTIRAILVRERWYVRRSQLRKNSDLKTLIYIRILCENRCIIKRAILMAHVIQHAYVYFYVFVIKWAETNLTPELNNKCLCIYSKCQLISANNVKNNFYSVLQDF